jgi:phosphoribosyl 1,2-cyclic phosphodiesterase
VTAGVELTFYGVRGSTPCDGKRYERYGGNTSCVALEAPGHQPVIFDLGTGLRAYGDVVTDHYRAELEGNRVTTPYRATVLLTHLHWDHIMGLPFFTPVFRPDACIDVYGPRQASGLRDVFTGIMQPPYFPITPDDLGGKVTFVDVADEEFAVNGAKVSSRWVRHTDPTLGFRLELEGRSVAYLSDHGPGCVPNDADDFIPNGVLELCDGVDVLMHDAQHTTAEYETKRHFGHSTIEYAVHVAEEAGARKLVLFHHCPTHGDNDVDAMLAHARDLASKGPGLEVLAAHEGLVLPIAAR